MQKRLSNLFVAIALMVAIIAGGAHRLSTLVSAQGELSAERPLVVAKLPDGSEVEGTFDSACWPQPTPETAECTFANAPDPTTSIALKRDEDLTILLRPDTNPVTEFKADIRPDPLPSGSYQPASIDLAATQGILSGASFDAGVDNFFVQVSAYFAASEGREYFVLVNFKVTASGTAPITPTTVAAGPTQEQTTSISPSATTEATAEVAIPTGPALDPTAAAADQTAQAAIAALNTLQATPGIASTTDVTAGTAAATTAGVIADSPTVTVTLSETPLPTETATPTDTATFTPTNTDTPTATFTPTFTATFTPTPTATFTPTNTATPTNTPTNTPIAPELFVRVGGRDFFPLRTVSSFVDAQGDEVTISRANRVSTFRIIGSPGGTAQIYFPGSRPATVSVALLSGDGLRELAKEAFAGDNLLLYTLPTTTGSYVLTVDVQFEGNRRAIYFFRLSVAN